jgi:hypothetical protein
MNGPSVRAGYRGNASLTSAANNQSNLLSVGQGAQLRLPGNA